MPQASPRQANRIAQALALLQVAGQSLLDPRSLASHGSEWTRSLAAAVWSTAAGAADRHLVAYLFSENAEAFLPDVHAIRRASIARLR